MFLLDLPDEVLVSIGKWVSCFDLKDFAHFQSSNRRIYSLLSHPEVLSSLVDIRSVAAPYRESITSLVRLYLYEVVRKAGLLEENRVGFDYGSPAVLEEDFENNGDETYIEESRTRLDTVRDILSRHGNLFGVMVDAHSGLGAPSLRLARRMSQARGIGICQIWFREFITHDAPYGVQMSAWSLDAAHAALRSDHPFKVNAATGRGWAELRLFVKGDEKGDFEVLPFVVPSRPNFYDGLVPEAILSVWPQEDEDEDDDNGYGTFFRFIMEGMNETSDEDEVDDSEDEDFSSGENDADMP